MQERTEWASGITLVVLGVIASLTIIIVVRFTDVPKEPWGYIGLAVGLLSALGGALLAFIRANEVSD